MKIRVVGVCEMYGSGCPFKYRVEENDVDSRRVHSIPPWIGPEDGISFRIFGDKSIKSIEGKSIEGVVANDGRNASVYNGLLGGVTERVLFFRFRTLVGDVSILEAVL